MKTRAGKAAMKEISAAVDKILIDMRDCSIELSKCSPRNLKKVYYLISRYQDMKKNHSYYLDQVSALCGMEAQLESALEWAMEDTHKPTQNDDSVSVNERGRR